MIEKTNEDYLDELEVHIDMYVSKFEDDLFFEKFFDVKSKKNAKKKIEVLKWCLENDETIINNEDYEKVCELFSSDVPWDI